MSLPTQTTQQVADNMVGQIEASLSQTVPLFPKAFTGVFVLLWKYAGAIFLQLFISTSPKGPNKCPRTLQT